MSERAPLESRTFTVPDGGRWRARIISRGPASPYLAAKVSRPLVEFEREDAPAPRRYAAMTARESEALDDAALVVLWSRARAY